MDRPDLLDLTSFELWEIKPNNPWSIHDGRFQLYGYIIELGATQQQWRAGAAASYPLPGPFTLRSDPTITVVTQYESSGDGLIIYDLVKSGSLERKAAVAATTSAAIVSFSGHFDVNAFEIVEAAYVAGGF